LPQRASVLTRFWRISFSERLSTDVLVPQVRVFEDEAAHHGDAVGVGQVDQLDAVAAHELGGGAAAAKAIKLLNGGEPIVHAVSLPGTDHRVIVEIPKRGRTDSRYPRAATVAKGKPLS